MNFPEVEPLQEMFIAKVNKFRNVGSIKSRSWAKYSPRCLMWKQRKNGFDFS